MSQIGGNRQIERYTPRMNMALLLSSALLAGSVAAQAKNHPDVERAIDTAIRGACGKIDSNLTTADLAKVTQLGLAERRIKDLTTLGELPNLRSLWLYRNQIIDLKALAKLKKLTHLDLGHTQIMDTGFKKKKLTKLKKLTWLGLKDTKITKAGVADLQKTLPNCKISHNAKK